MRFFQAVAKKTIERLKWCAFVTKKDRGLPCPIMKQEKAACHFRLHAALTPRRNAARQVLEVFHSEGFEPFSGIMCVICHVMEQFLPE